MSDETYSKQAARAAYGWGRMRNWDDALALIADAARAGEPGAERQLELVTQAPIADLLQPPTPQRLSKISRIGVARGFAPPGFNDWLIDRVSDRLVEAGVNDAGGKGVRTATTAAFGPQHRDLVLAIMQIRAARMVGVKVDQHEPPNIISYEPGQSFNAHVDFIDPAVPQFHDELNRLGQRSSTIVTYLNDDFDGAETFFPDAGVKFRGGIGDALVWSNLMPDGSPDYHSGHSALPPTRGRKWVLSQWIRTKPYPYPLELLA